MNIIKNIVNRPKKFSSKKYWDDRYKEKGNSGDGSYGDLASFKAGYINKIIKDNNIETVYEFGCGDGNNLKYYNIRNYIGTDVSETVMDWCKEMFSRDGSKRFISYNNFWKNIDLMKLEKPDMTMSLDVVYHLIEDTVFEKHMEDLFRSRRFVLIYASNEKERRVLKAQHVKMRRFTDWVNKNKKDWKLLEVERQKYPDQSRSDFYLFERI